MNRAELEQQLEQLHPASFAWALGCCGRDPDLAEDVLQETYLKIFEGKALFGGRSTLKTWLFAVIRRTAARQRRFRWLCQIRSLREIRDLVPEPAGEESAERRLIQSERAAALVRALGNLPRRQREVIELVFYHDLTIEQAAGVIGVSLGTARVHYERGKRGLVARLRQEEAR